ncbi:MAG: glycosyltransferase family 4 protein [Verrucomicrobia bacterium]|nr:glycosyltransferase family 4 protein [Verrucomicrobiota bacterium]
MKVCIDIQSAVTQRAGVGRYTRELVQHLAAMAEPDDRFLLPYFDFKGNAAPFELPNAELKAVRWCPGRIAQLAWKTLRWPPYDVFSGEADLYHFPNFIIPPLRRKKAIVTIHDMSFMAYPHFAEEGNVRYLRRHLEETAKRADAIITISHFSAREICRYLDVSESRVFPVYLGIADRFARPDSETTARVLADCKLDRPYLLTVGTVEPRKNIPFLVEAFEQLKDFDGDLVIAGGYGWKYEPVLERIRKSPRAESIRCLGYTSDEQLPSLYAGASAFVTTSHYEGFGFPPVEAMACGTPVVSSMGGSLAEVLGDGALLIEGSSAEDWAEQIRRVLGDSALRETLIHRGRNKAASYSWAKTAKETMDVYRRVAS